MGDGWEGAFSDDQDTSAEATFSDFNETASVAGVDFGTGPAGNITGAGAGSAAIPSGDITGAGAGTPATRGDESRREQLSSQLSILTSIFGPTEGGGRFTALNPGVQIDQRPGVQNKFLQNPKSFQSPGPVAGFLADKLGIPRFGAKGFDLPVTLGEQHEDPLTPFQADPGLPDPDPIDFARSRPGTAEDIDSLIEQERGVSIVEAIMPAPLQAMMTVGQWLAAASGEGQIATLTLDGRTTGVGRGGEVLNINIPEGPDPGGNDQVAFGLARPSTLIAEAAPSGEQTQADLLSQLINRPFIQRDPGNRFLNPGVSIGGQARRTPPIGLGLA
jgi:hypothetical protein